MPEEVQQRVLEDGGADAAERRAMVEAAYAKCHDALLRTVASASRSQGEDALQDLFLFLLGWERVTSERLTLGYLRTCLRRLMARKGKRLSWERLQQERAAIEAQAHGPERRATPREPGDLTAVLAAIRAPLRDAVELAVCRDLPYAEASRSLGVSESTLNNWRHRGVAELRERALDHERAIESPSHVRSRADHRDRSGDDELTGRHS